MRLIKTKDDYKVYLMCRYSTNVEILVTYEYKLIPVYGEGIVCTCKVDLKTGTSYSFKTYDEYCLENHNDIVNLIKEAIKEVDFSEKV